MADTQDLVYKPADEVGSLRNNLRNHQKIMELPKTLTKINTKMGREGAWEWKSKNSKKQENTGIEEWYTLPNKESERWWILSNTKVSIQVIS